MFGSVCRQALSSPCSPSQHSELEQPGTRNMHSVVSREGRTTAPGIPLAGSVPGGDPRNLGRQWTVGRPELTRAYTLHSASCCRAACGVCRHVWMESRGPDLAGMGESAACWRSWCNAEERRMHACTACDSVEAQRLCACERRRERRWRVLLRAARRPCARLFARLPGCGVLTLEGGSVECALACCYGGGPSRDMRASVELRV